MKNLCFNCFYPIFLDYKIIFRKTEMEKMENLSLNDKKESSKKMSKEERIAARTAPKVMINNINNNYSFIKTLPQMAS